MLNASLLNDTVEAGVPPYVPPACPEQVVQLSYMRLRQVIMSMALVGVGMVLGLISVMCALVSMVRKMDTLVTQLRKETGAESRAGLTQKNGAASRSNASGKKASANTTSCAEDEADDSD